LLINYALFLYFKPSPGKSGGFYALVSNCNWGVSDMNGSGSDGFVLDGFLGVDDALLVEDTVSTVSALDGIVGLQLRLLPAL
jgi:hypothetical protein